MGRRVQLWLLVCSLGGCWSEDARVDGLSPAQWDHLREEFAPPPQPSPCDNLGQPVAPSQCKLASLLGQQLFFEPALSGTGTVACVTCHATHTPTGKPSWFADLRVPDAVSQGATSWTKHNSISLVNIALKQDLPPADKRIFTWTGECANRPCDTPAAVIADIALPKAMASSPTIVSSAIAANDEYRAEYVDLFGGLDDASVIANVSVAFTAYMRRLTSTSSQFDRFIIGDDSAIDEAAQRGFALFAGKAMCIECHRGPLFTDNGFHVTGVQQTGEHVPTTDPGFAGTGKFYTAPLRQIAQTGPYMHDGSLPTLASVIQFYRWGGLASDYPKDRLMQPLDITDDEAADLETFLKTLTGTPVDTLLTEDIR